MEKLTKKDLRGPDMFVSNVEKLGDWAYRYRKQATAVLVGVAVIAIVWAVLGTYSAHQEDEASDALFRAERTLHTAQEAFSPAPQVGPDGKPLKDQKPAAVASGNLDVDYKGPIEDLKSLINKYPHTQASVIAALDLASLYYDYKKHDQGIEVLQAASKVADHPATRALVLDNLGLNYEAKGDCDGAITQWQRLQEDKNMAPFQASALIKSALCYEKLGKNDKAIEIYKKFDAAEKEKTQLIEALAAKDKISLRVPIQFQPPAAVAKFQKDAQKSSDITRLDAFLSDQDSVKAAKKYLQLLNKGKS